MKDDHRPRFLLAGAAVLVAGGIALAATTNTVLGGVLALLGWIGFILGLHLYGRLGAERLP